MKLRAFGLAAALLISPAIAFARSSFGGPMVADIPVEFILFAIVLLGVALFHRHTFPIAAGGALVIALYKIFLSPFASGKKTEAHRPTGREPDRHRRASGRKVARLSQDDQARKAPAGSSPDHSP